MARKSRKKSDTDFNFRVFNTGIYARLSRERQKKEKIETQIEEVKQYIESRHIFKLIDVYSDDGYTGTNFQRPAFQRLMEDLRNGIIDCIIVKDLSRFAREHIGAEDYLNNIFPFLGVRFIAINDGYDNINIEPREYFLASFKNLAHSHFAQETSRKACMAKKALQEQGKFIGSKVAYGYKRDPNDKHKLIIDEEKAPVIREIFERTANGETSGEISRDLNKRQIYTYDNCEWNSPGICALLKKEIYIGTLIQRTTVQAFYKNEAVRHVPKDEQIRFENAVPAIISKELWDKAHAKSAEKKAKRHEGIPENPYKNLVFCGKCGKKVDSGYRRDLTDFTFNCFKCKSGVFAQGKHLNDKVRNNLKLDGNTEISRDLIVESFEKIVVFDRNNITMEGKGGANS